MRQQHEMDPGQNDQEAKASSNLGAIPATPPSETLSHLQHDDRIAAKVTTVAIIIGLIFFSLTGILTLGHPAPVVVTTMIGLLSGCIPFLVYQFRRDSWKRLQGFRDRKIIEAIINTSDGDVKKHAMDMYRDLILKGDKGEKNGKN